MNDTAKMGSGPAHKILIVDDNPRLLRMLEMRFSESGYQATVMERVKDALIASITEKPDLIIADVMMPEISGWEFKKLLNNIPNMAEIPFIFLTANESLPLESYTEEFGPIDHLRKPYSFEELLAKVETNLKRKVKREETKSVESENSRGTLEYMTLVDVMQVLAMNRKTCSVTLVKGKEVGKIYFHEGRLLDAKIGGLRGDDVVYELLAWKGADFSIGDEPKTTIEATVTKDLHALIAEGLQRIEEAEWLTPSSAGQAGAGRLGPEEVGDLPESLSKFPEGPAKFPEGSSNLPEGPADLPEEDILSPGGAPLPEGYMHFPENEERPENKSLESAARTADRTGFTNGPVNFPEEPDHPAVPRHHPPGRSSEDTKSFLERMKKLGLVKERTS